MLEFAIDWIRGGEKGEKLRFLERDFCLEN